MINYNNEEVAKGDKPPSVGGGGGKVEEKCIDQNQERGMALKGIGAARGTFIQSTRYSPNTNITDMTDAAAYGVKKRYWYLSLEGPIKDTANKCEYNRFTILTF